MVGLLLVLGPEDIFRFGVRAGMETRDGIQEYVSRHPFPVLFEPIGRFPAEGAVWIRELDHDALAVADLDPLFQRDLFHSPGKQLLPFLRGEIFPFLCYDVTENEVAVPGLEVEDVVPCFHFVETGDDRFPGLLRLHVRETFM